MTDVLVTAGEDRTAYVSFGSTDVAIEERRRMNGYEFQGDALNISFSTKPHDQEAVPYRPMRDDAIPGAGQQQQQQMGGMGMAGVYPDPGALAGQLQQMQNTLM